MRQRKVPDAQESVPSRGKPENEGAKRTKKKSVTQRRVAAPAPHNNRAVSCLKKLGRALLQALSGVLMFIILCAIYNVVILRFENAEFQPPGQLVDVGGYKLHLYCQGTNSYTPLPEETTRFDEPRFYPTVVFDHGLLTLSNHFYKVLASPLLTQKTRICLYDRAGYGFSQPTAKRRSPQIAAEELHALLHNAGEQGPFLFVGSSRGGLNVLHYADTYYQKIATASSPQEKEIAGMILLDTFPPEVQLPPELQKLERSVSLLLRLTPLFASTGLTRALNGIMEFARTPSALYDSKDSRYINWVQCKPDYWRMVVAEFEEGEKSIDELAQKRVQAEEPRWDFPLTVVSAGIFPPPMNSIQESWLEGQRKLATFSSNSTLVIADQSDHHIPVNQPELIANLIAEMLDRTVY